jgi:CheY-like chemotaxis protein
MKTFISSTYDDLVHYREMVALAIERLGHQAIRMEVFGARPTQATTICFDEIKNSDAFIGLYAHRYGYVPSGNNKSITEMELDYALQVSLPTFCYFVDEDFPWTPRFIDSDPARSKLIALKTRISDIYVRDTFTTADDLAFKVAATLGRFLFTERIKTELKTAPPSQVSLIGADQVSRRSVRIGDIIKGAKLLLVNDHPDEMRVVIRVFEHLKLDVSIAESTEEAISFLRGQKIDVVISDMMRGSNERAGLDLLKKMRACRFQLPVIFTIGRLKLELGTPAYAFGITNRIDELLNLVFDALERLRG